MYDYYMEELVYQKFILGTGLELDEALKKGLGGVIFFTKDIESEAQFKKLVEDIKSKAVIRPFLSIDQEGGRVERTENIHPRYLSARYAFDKGQKFLREQSAKIAKELVGYGLNLNFAPCADVNTNPNNPIIGERSFSSKTEDVVKGINIVSDEFRKNGIIPCLKHYPGHGDADKDSHLTLPQIDLPLDIMEKVHIKPFREQADMIMVAHLHCTCFDKDVIPASLSKNTIGYLRNNIGYDGVVITDDMVMKGVQDFGAVEACIMAIEAGVDMFIYREADNEVLKVIDSVLELVKNSKILKQKVLESDERIKKLKQRFL